MNKYLLLIGAGIFAVLIIFGLLFYVIFGRNVQQQLAPNHVVATNPANNATNVDVSSSLSITLEKPLANTDTLSFTFAPMLPNQTYGIVKKPAATDVTVKPRGLMAAGTTYAVTVLLNQSTIYQFSFTTTTTGPQTDVETVNKAQEDLFKDHPLLKYMPYETQDAIMYYTGPFALHVIIKQGTQDQVKKEVEAWIRSHGVDPATHQIAYTNQ